MTETNSASPPTAPTPPRPPSRLAPPAPPAPPALPGGLMRRMGTVLKMGMIFLLVLLLLIPLHMIRSVLAERMARRAEAVRDIASTWGLQQVVVGPVLIVPYRTTVKAWKEQVVNGRPERTEVVETVTANAFFLPESLAIQSDVQPQERHRGIYDVVVYNSDLQLKGHFAPPDFSLWKVTPDDVLWDDARVTIAVTDLRGAQGAIRLSFGGREVAMAPGSLLPGFDSGLNARLRGLGGNDEGWDFALNLGLNGSDSIQFAPVGMTTEVAMVSNWPDPSFQGAFLPTKHDIRADGFDASWKISYYGRPYPQQWSDRDRTGAPSSGALRESLFGATFVQVVDFYRLVERSIKYGILFIALVFTAFFLFEVLGSLRIHAFQYTLVGAALCLFYLALLSLSEFIPFGAAYLVGAAASSLLIVLYCASVLKGGRRAGGVGALLALIYTFLYVILRLQDYSLLFGTAGLFLALAVVMYTTRKIDWNAKDVA